MRSSAYRPLPSLLFSLTLLFGVAEGCASISSKGDAPPTLINLSDGGPTPTLIAADGSLGRGLGSDAGVRLNPLCGNGVCHGALAQGQAASVSQPDSPLACAGFDPRGAGGGGGGGNGAGAAPGASGKGGTGAEELRDAALLVDARPDAEPDAAPASRDAGRPRDGGFIDGDGSDGSLATESGGSRGESGDSALPYAPTPTVDAGALYSCQVRPADNGGRIYQCVPAGGGAVGSPCAGAADCRAGLACVGSVGAGQCQRYCCDATNCKPMARADGGTISMFCNERPLLEGRTATNLDVPVCVPADGCALDEHDCKGEKCVCTGETSCAVVGRDGSTGCVKPGPGKSGDACDSRGVCGTGYFCSATNQCIKICKPGFTDSLCQPGLCQAVAGLPKGFGLCVGVPPATR